MLQRIVLSLLILFSGVNGLRASSEDTTQTPYSYIFSVYPLRSFAPYIMVAVEKSFNKNMVIKGVVGYTYFKDREFDFNIFSDNIINKSGYRGELFLKKFIGKKGVAYKGFYIGTSLAYKSCDFSYSENGLVINSWAGAFMISVNAGYQIIVADSYSIDVFVGEGVGKSWGNYKIINSQLDAYKNNIGIHMGLCFGFGLK